MPLFVPDLGGTVQADFAQAEQAAQFASDLASAQQALADATDANLGVEREQAQAKSAADALAAQAKAAKKKAEASAAFATALIREAGWKGLGSDPLAAVLGTNGDLLTKLGAVDRLRTLAGDRTTALRDAAADAKAATSLRGQAEHAADALAGIDVDASEQAITEAQARVDTASAALAQLPTLLTAGTGWQALTVDPSAIATGWVLPVRGPMTDPFGPRPSRPAGTAPFHPGDDIGAACGTTIVAAAEGTVLAAGPNGSYGNFVLIDHGGGVETAYGHIRDGGIGVTVGQHVAAGQPIAQVGSTGASTGCHLHLEVRVNGVQIDPYPFFAARGVIVGTR